jgi:hypothetical protein
MNLQNVYRHSSVRWCDLLSSSSLMKFLKVRMLYSSKRSRQLFRTHLSRRRFWAAMKNLTIVSGTRIGWKFVQKLKTVQLILRCMRITIARITSALSFTTLNTSCKKKLSRTLRTLFKATFLTTSMSLRIKAFTIFWCEQLTKSSTLRCLSDWWRSGCASE